MPTRNNLSRIVLILWVFSALAVGVIILSVLNGNLLIQSSNNHSPTFFASQTFTPSPSPTFQPTHTPLPATPTKISPSSTPVLNEPLIIGTSVAGRDLEVFNLVMDQLKR